MKRRNRCKAKLRIYPDPILKAVCEPVGDDEDVSDIIRDMMYILTNSKTGVGLAAPQAGYKKRVIIVTRSCWIMINPIITWKGTVKVSEQEGCLSCPGKTRRIIRNRLIVIDYTTEDGKRLKHREFYDWRSRIIQHEIQHLDGNCKIGE